MKYIVGVVPVGALSAVTEALGRAEIYRLTVSEVEVLEFGGDLYLRGEDSSDSDLRRLRLEVAVNDDFFEPALAAFREAESADPDHGPFWISILPLEDAVRIRTGETGSDAI